jgi:hypothetical protein
MARSRVMQIGAPTDVNDDMFGEAITHGTVFYRSV